MRYPGFFVYVFDEDAPELTQEPPIRPLISAVFLTLPMLSAGLQRSQPTHSSPRNSHNVIRPGARYPQSSH